MLAREVHEGSRLNLSLSNSSRRQDFARMTSSNARLASEGPGRPPSQTAPMKDFVFLTKVCFYV
jgi:hypothetical protein